MGGLVALSVVEQRYRAVIAVQSGASITSVAADVGVSRQTMSACVARYRGTRAGWFVGSVAAAAVVSASVWSVAEGIGVVSWSACARRWGSCRFRTNPTAATRDVR